MVYTKVNRVKDLGRKLGYIRRPEKTDGGRYVSMFGIKGDEPGREFMDTVRDSGRERGARAIHFMVSFAGEDISPVIAHEIGMIMCADYFRGYKSVLCTHTDKNNTHFVSFSGKYGSIFLIKAQGFITKAFSLRNTAII